MGQKLFYQGMGPIHKSQNWASPRYQNFGHGVMAISAFEVESHKAILLARFLAWSSRNPKMVILTICRMSQLPGNLHVIA